MVIAAKRALRRKSIYMEEAQCIAYGMRILMLQRTGLLQVLPYID
jgi:hypothetical protein